AGVARLNERHVYPLPRQQELLVVVAARLDGDAAVASAVQGSDGGAVRRGGAQFRQSVILAVGTRALPARWRRGGLGFARDRGVPRRTASGPVARRSGREGVGAFGRLRNALRLFGA